MNYQIMRVEETHSGQWASLNADGNKFYVYYHGEDGVEAVKKEIETMESAMELFMKFVDAFGYGTHSVKDRAAWLS